MSLAKQLHVLANDVLNLQSAEKMWPEQKRIGMKMMNIVKALEKSPTSPTRDALKELREKVNSMFIIPEAPSYYDAAYNQAIQEVLALIDAEAHSERDSAQEGKRDSKQAGSESR